LLTLPNINTDKKQFLKFLSETPQS
jgi:hypothetical protein